MMEANLVTEEDPVFTDRGKEIRRQIMERLHKAVRQNTERVGEAVRQLMESLKIMSRQACSRMSLRGGWEIIDGSGNELREEEETDMCGADHHLWCLWREEGGTDMSGADHHLWCLWREEGGTGRSGADHHLWRQSSVHHVNCSSLFSQAAALVISSILMTWSGAGAVCVGREVAVDRGQAVVRCPLTADANKIEHGIIVKHFSNSTSYPEAVLTCYWTGPNKYDCRSNFDFKLMEPVTDLVMAKVPKAKLRKDGSYKCQLYPPDYDQPFTPCEIFRSDDPEDPPTTERPVGHPPPADLCECVPGASEKPLTGADGVPENGCLHEGLVVAVVVLAFTMFIHLLLDVGVMFCYVRTRGWMKPRKEGKKLKTRHEVSLPERQIFVEPEHAQL